MVKTVFTQEGSLRLLASRCLSNLKNLVAVNRKVTFASLSGQLSERSLFTCTCYMHASTTSIEVTTPCNVHRFFPVLLNLGKMKIVNTHLRYFGKFSMIANYTFWQHCSSCDINFPSIATKKPQKWIHTIHRDTSIQFGHCNQENSCSVRKCMVHITNRRWSVQPLHLVVLTRFPRWYYKKLHVISTRKILLKTILITRFLVTVPRNFSQCSMILHTHNQYNNTLVFISFLIESCF